MEILLSEVPELNLNIFKRWTLTLSEDVGESSSTGERSDLGNHACFGTDNLSVPTNKGDSGSLKTRPLENLNSWSTRWV